MPRQTIGRSWSENAAQPEAVFVLSQRLPPGVCWRITSARFFIRADLSGVPTNGTYVKWAHLALGQNSGMVEPMAREVLAVPEWYLAWAGASSTTRYMDEGVVMNSSFFVPDVISFGFSMLKPAGAYTVRAWCQFTYQEKTLKGADLARAISNR